MLTSSQLRQLDAVLFFTSGELALTNQQESDLLAFVHGGGGFEGVHSATDTLYSWPELGHFDDTWARCAVSKCDPERVAVDYRLGNGKRINSTKRTIERRSTRGGGAWSSTRNLWSRSDHGILASGELLGLEISSRRNPRPCERNGDPHLLCVAKPVERAIPGRAARIKLRGRFVGRRGENVCHRKYQGRRGSPGCLGTSPNRARDRWENRDACAGEPGLVL